MLPELHMRDFHIDEKQLEEMAEKWESLGAIELEDDIEVVLATLKPHPRVV